MVCYTRVNDFKQKLLGMDFGVITIYSTNTCAYCKQVKKYFDLKGVEYFEANMDEEPKYRKALGMITDALTVPVTVKSDEQGYPVDVIVGWNAGRLAQMIA